MPALPERLYTAQQTRELDACAIDGHGIPGYTLMCRAGEACFQVLESCWPAFRSLTVLCGGGNNGGDGYVIARLARAAGRQVQVIALSDTSALKGDAQRAWEDWLAMGGQCETWQEGAELQGELLVDALLGTGLDREVGGRYRNVIDVINCSGRPVLAVDIPSGLSADSGSVLGCAVRAAATVTFIGLKRGLFTAQATDHTGEIRYASLETPDAIFDQVPSHCRLLDERLLDRSLKPRGSNSHKGDFGAVLVVGGDFGMPGAVRLAGLAALRSGAGLVKICTHQAHAGMLPLGQTELMSAAVEDGPALSRHMQWADVLAVGPGLGQSDWSETLMREVMGSELPMVLDADGLNWLADNPCRRGRWVLTPHPGEAARLLECSVNEIQNDRFEAAKSIAGRYDCVCVLKGAGTIIADGDSWSLCRLGNPGMATAGMGDVLTGVTAAMLGQGMATRQAAEVAVCVHARAGDRAAENGQRGMIAGDVIEHLREVVNPQ